MILSGAILLTACRSEHSYKEEDLFFDYKISAEEGYDSASVLIQVRLRSITGPTVALQDNAGMMLDEETIPRASSRVTGEYFALSKQIPSISGKHTITYVAADGKKYRTSFDFHPFQLVSLSADTLNSAELTIHFSGLDTVDRLQLLLTDTSFASEGVNRSATVRDNELRIAPEELSGLASGPLQLELQKFIELRFRRGMMITSYVIRREIWKK
jgi:hypothetical protein